MTEKLRVGVVGVGKMGLSHLSLLGAHTEVDLAAMCDSNGYLLDTLSKYTGIRGITDYSRLVADPDIDALVIATPTTAHFPMVRTALENGKHVFCEKPLTLSGAESGTLAAIAAERGLRTQVGYHNRFVAAFAEARRLLDLGAIGTVTHALAEAYGPVVLRPKGSTWRTRRDQGGGALYDYAAHPLDLLAWYLGEPTSVRGTVLAHIFSTDTEDAVYSTLDYGDGRTAQLSVNWSDESYRKMSTKVTLWGTHGRITVDRQECQVYLTDTAVVPDGYRAGWNVRYTTDLTEPVWFYLRGEEYSAEIDYFVRSVRGTLPEGRAEGLNTFASASVTDRVMELMLTDSEAAGTSSDPETDGLPAPSRSRARARAAGRVRSTVRGLRDRRRAKGRAR
jgi:scyllo-inositol 2-dehydrogenase (NADP+)